MHATYRSGQSGGSRRVGDEWATSGMAKRGAQGVHYLCSTFGSAGDVYPMLGLACELQRRGHEVTLATNDHFRDVVQRHGLMFEPLGTDEQYQACLRDPALWTPRKAFGHVFSHLRPVLLAQYDLHERELARGPLVAVTNCFGMGALLAQEKLGVPTVTLHLQPAVLWSDHEPPTLPGVFGPRWLRSWLYWLGEKMVVDPVVCPFLNAWRAELGLPPVSRITRWWNSPTGVIAMFPEWFAAAQPDWPRPLVQTNFPLWSDGGDQPLDGEVIAFLASGTRPLVFTAGTANAHARDFFAAAMQACRELGRRGLFLTRFTEQLPVDLPDTIRAFRYVPLETLLEDSAAFIHHGGVGSTSQALAAGVPQVLMPLAHDQFDNAERVRRLGVGAGIPAPRFTAARLTAALRGLLDDPGTADRCRAMAARLKARDGLCRTAEAVEQLADGARKTR